MRKAIYPGSFDPLTNGHLSIIQRGLQMFDGLVVALAINPNKTALFSVAERMDFLREAVSDPRVEIDDFEGLLVHYAKKRNVPVILRGLRAVSDFDYEFQMANMNRKLAPEIETVFMMTGEEAFYVSSSLVKEVASFGGNLEGVVPEGVRRALEAKFKKA